MELQSADPLSEDDVYGLAMSEEPDEDDGVIGAARGLSRTTSTRHLTARQLTAPTMEVAPVVVDPEAFATA